MTMQSRPAVGPVLLVLVVIMTGLNLRPFLTAVGPLADELAAHSGLGLQGLAMMTLAPMLLMGVFAFAGPALAARIGARRAVVGALGVLSLGSLLRLFAPTGAAMIGTAVVVGIGAAIVQAVFPGLIKRHFSAHVSVVTGLYSSMMMGGGAVGALAAPVVAAATGEWRAGLAWLAVPAAFACLLAAFALPRETAAARGANPAAGLLGRPRAWLLMACFGLVNGGYATAVAWLSPAYRELGWTATASAGLVAIMAVAQAVSALGLPTLARHSSDRRPWLWAALAMQGAGFAGIIFAPQAAAFLWVALLGAGLGGSFALMLVVALDHHPDPARAGGLAALMQGGGFLLAAVPPWIVALLHETTGGFPAGWLMHLCFVAAVSLLVIRLSPASYARALAFRAM